MQRVLPLSDHPQTAIDYIHIIITYLERLPHRTKYVKYSTHIHTSHKQ